MPSKERSFAYIKSRFLDRLFACWLLRKLWASSFARSVKFLSLLSEWVGEWCSAWDNHLDSKIRSQNVHFHDSFSREKTLAATKLFLSLTRISFAVAVSSRAVRISSRDEFFRAYHFDAYGPHTGPFLLWFSKEIARGAVRVIWLLTIRLRVRVFYER